MYKDKEQQKEFQRKWAKERKRKQNETKNKLKAGGCVNCGEKELCCLDFHHIGEKSFGIGGSDGKNNMSYRTPKSIELEAAKCIVLCRNCHAKLHAGLIVYETTMQN
jgi:hypothetical protein